MTQQNPFEPPGERADGDDENAAPGYQPRKLRLYTPNQVALATLLGGPLAASWLLSFNYGALGKPKARYTAWVLGIVATLSVFIATAALTEWMSGRSRAMVSVATYTFGARELARLLQGRDIDRVVASGGTKESTWLAVGFGFVCLFCSAILIVLFGFILFTANVI